MPDATIENVQADRGEARRRLTQARKHLDSARAAVDNESAYIQNGRSPSRTPTAT